MEIDENKEDKFANIYDILCLKKYREKKFFLQRNISPYDSSNVTFISLRYASRHFIATKDRELFCTNCNKSALYLHDTNYGYLCPICSFDKVGRYVCKFCECKIGCDCCGGKDFAALQLDNKLICLNAGCLMQLGYYEPFPDLECTCPSEMYKIINMQDKLPRVLCNVVDSMLTVGERDCEMYKQIIQLGHIFPGLNKDKCIKCQIERNCRQIHTYKQFVSFCSCMLSRS
jgi:hypothetical protein